jgi:hypothetical protein
MEVTVQHHAPADLSRKKQIRTEQEAQSTPEPVWTIRRREKSVAPAEIRTYYVYHVT